MSGILYKPETGEVGGRFRHPKTKDGWTWLDYDIDTLPDVDNSLLTCDGENVTVNQTAQTEALWNEVRQQRDRLLKESDWTMAADSPLTDEQTILAKSYRQELRDIPQKQNDPNNIVWPTEPEF